MSVKDPLSIAPDAYTLIFENEKVRVLRSMVKVGARVRLHHHPDRVVCVVDNAELRLKSPGAGWENKTLKSGEAYWAPAIDHEAENSGTVDSQNIVIELK